MEPWLIVGLGNPGPTYALNRHNVGAMVIADLAAAAGVKFKSHKARAMVAQMRLGTLPGGLPGPPVLLAIPRTFMNLSGGPVAGLANFFSIPTGRIAVVHDELDVDFGTVRIKYGGGEGGHNGLRSISASLGTKDYVRLRCGIGRPPGRQEPADFVLSNFATRDAEDVALLIADAGDAVTGLVQQGLAATQQRFHSR